MKLMEPWYHQPAVNFGANSNMKASKATGNIARGLEYHRWFYKTLKLEVELNHAEAQLLIEPWYRSHSWTQRSPDAVLLLPNLQALVVEVKLNWKDGRDTKLLTEYLPIVEAAHGVKAYPLLVTNNIRGYQHPPLLGLRHLLTPLSWNPGKPTPLLLQPKRG